MEQRADEVTDTSQITKIKEAIHKVKDEIKDMDERIGIYQSLLIAKMKKDNNNI